MSDWGANLRMLRHLRAAQVLARLRARALAPWFESALYGALCLRPRQGTALLRVPPRPWPGDAENGRRILEGRLRLIGRERPFAERPDWSAADAPLLWRFTLHYFDWLADLAATGQATAPRARALIEDWIAAHPRPEGLAWHPYPLSLRLYAWLAQARFLTAGDDGRFQASFLRSLDRQARHLGRSLERDLGGNHLIKNLKALIAAGLCLEGHAGRVRPGLALLERQVKLQILPDGGHYERSPYYHLQVLCDLLDLRDLLADAAQVPAWLDEAIGRMGRALAFFRHGDGGLALFNDGGVGAPAMIDAAMDRRGGPAAPPAALGDSGYYRLAAKGSLALLDAGPCCPDDLPGHAHADALSFELSDGPQRIVVNGGTYAYQDQPWRNRFRGTAAHSTVEIDGQDSAEVFGAFRLGRRPRAVGATRSGEDGLAVEAHHDGYAHLGLLHRRRLELSGDGQLLSGEDRVERIRASGTGNIASAHFHLHPTVAAVAQADGAIRLTFPGGAWRFEHDGDHPLIEPSLYSPGFYERFETRQIVLREGMAGPLAVFRWRFRRLES